MMLLSKVTPLYLVCGIVALVASGIAATPSQASQTGAARNSAKVTVAGIGSARFDWLAGGQRQKKTLQGKQLTRAPVGNGQWICSPAGFGKQASCFRR